MSEKTKKKSKTFTTPPFRLSYPNLFEAVRQGEEGKGDLVYNCQAIFYPKKFSDSELDLWKKILAELDKVSQSTFEKAWRSLGSAYKKGLRAVSEEGAFSVEKGYGDGTGKAGNVGYDAHSVFAALSRKAKVGQPGVVLRKIDEDTGKPMIVSEENGNTDEIYPGCWCRATVTVYSYNRKGNKGVALGLSNIQKLKDGERLDSRTKPEDDFDEELDDKWLGDEDDDAVDGTSGDGDDEDEL